MVEACGRNQNNFHRKKAKTKTASTAKKTQIHQTILFQFIATILRKSIKLLSATKKDITWGRRRQ